MRVKEADLSGSEARGRNGWFVPARVEAYRDEATGQYGVRLFSRRNADTPPIWLLLSEADRQALRAALDAEPAPLPLDPEERLEALAATHLDAAAAWNAGETLSDRAAALWEAEARR